MEITVPRGYNISKLEKGILKEIDKVRMGFHLPAFRYCPLLEMAAKVHTGQMVIYDFFDHTNPRNKQLERLMDRISFVQKQTKSNFPYRCFGENLADYCLYNSFLFVAIPFAHKRSIQKVFWKKEEELATGMVAGWMNSPGHRKNILNPDFKFIGQNVLVRNKKISNDEWAPYSIVTHNFGG